MSGITLVARIAVHVYRREQIKGYNFILDNIHLLKRKSLECIRRAGHLNMVLEKKKTNKQKKKQNKKPSIIVILNCSEETVYTLLCICFF
jgi:hypothetical protein